MKTRCLVLATLVAFGLITPAAHANPLLDDWLLPVAPFRTASRTPAAANLVDPDTGAKVVRWLDDKHILLLKDGKLLQVHALTGKAEAYFGAERWEPESDHAGPFGLPQKGGKGMGSSATSPDGRWVSSVRGGNLFITEQATKAERQITKDGSDVILNGKADWVYWEEIFHRSKAPTSWWSPDSAYLAFLRFDDTDVPKFTIIDHTQRQQTPEVTRYPKVGATNPTVKFGIIKVADGSIAWTDFSDFPKDFLISRVGWLADGKAAYVYVQDRIQTWLDVCTVLPEGGKPTKLYRDKTEAWIEDIGPLKFLKDGSFLAFSERTGYKHLYHRAADGKLKEQITTGAWDVSSIDKIDEEKGEVNFTRTTDGWLGTQAYQVRLDGTRMKKLTTETGTHEVLFSPDGSYFTDTCYSDHGPQQIQLRRSDGTFVRVIDQSPKQKSLAKYEFVQITTPDGFVLNGSVTLPPNADKAKKYPVWFMTYGGPHAPSVKKGSGASKRDQELAAEGYIVFHADPRSASGKGAVSAWTCYRQLGVQETKDIETAIHWLLDTYPFADPKRVGMSGHSYGGYMTAYCMTHTKLFAAGIAGAPPTDWRNYDSIYTERYMSTPDDNPDGYEVSSVTKAAKNLHGRLLLVHGMKDDNVHVQNTVEFMDALQIADRDFEVMLYPHARHGIGGDHYQRLLKDFMKRTLQPGS
jgi:dipeptidyl-peptidase-4